MQAIFKTITILAVLAVAACVKAPSDAGKGNIEINKDFQLTTMYTVPVTEGFVTRVKYGEDVLALTDVAMSIEVPKVAIAENTLKVEKLSYGELPEFQKGSGVSEANYILMFEDSKNTDYDYNDFVAFVMHRMYVVQGECSFDVYVKPMSLGSTKSLVFGFEDNLGNTVILSDDLRKDYFNGAPNFINTNKGTQFLAPISTDADDIQNITNNKLLVTKQKNGRGEPIQGGYYIYRNIRSQQSTGGQDDRKINYFIQEKGNPYKYYVAGVDKGEGQTLPYGIAIPSFLATYPNECQAMREVFPLFESWINNAESAPNWSKVGNDTGKGYKIDTECLYRWFDV